MLSEKPAQLLHLQIDWFGLVSTESQLIDLRCRLFIDWCGLLCRDLLLINELAKSYRDRSDLDLVNYCCCIDLKRYLWSKTYLRENYYRQSWSTDRRYISLGKEEEGNKWCWVGTFIACFTFKLSLCLFVYFNTDRTYILLGKEQVMLCGNLYCLFYASPSYLKCDTAGYTETFKLLSFSTIFGGKC